MLNIITGRTGSGKTRLIRSMAAEIATNEADKVIIIVPEQFSFETEKGMLQLLGNGKINNVEILSFVWCLYYITSLSVCKYFFVYLLWYYSFK